MPVNSDNFSLLIVVGMLGIFLVALLVILLQVRNRSRVLLQRQLRAEDAVRHQRELLQTFIRSQEEERKRIGRDLHDEVGTVLSALRMQLGAEGAGDQQLRAEARKLIDAVMQQVRYISHDLSPFVPGAFGFTEALEELTERVNRSGSLRAELEIGEGVELLREEAGLSLYRVITELVNNTIRHAQGKVMQIRLFREEGGIRVLYRDDGIGMQEGVEAARGMGLSNIGSRLQALGAEYRIGRGREEIPGEVGQGGGSVIGRGGPGFRMDILIPVKASL